MAAEPAAGEYRIAVSVAQGDQVEQLMRTAIDLARENDGDVFVVSVVVEPPSSPFRVFRDEVIKEEFSGDRREILDRAMAAAEGTGVDVDGRLVVADSVVTGVVTAVEEYDFDAVLMGWHARRREDIVMGRNVDEIVSAAPCDVLVEKIGPTANGVETVLLPAGEDRHTKLAAMVSRAIARANDARVDVVRVVPPTATAEKRERATRLAEEVAADVGDVETNVAVIEGEDVTTALVEAAEERDVTAIGGGRGGWLRQFVVGSTARDVGQRAQTTVIVATRGHGLWSRFARIVTRFPRP